MQSAIQILSNPSMSSLLESKTSIIVPKQSRQKQRVVLKFLLSEGETVHNISRRLKQVYGDGAIDYSTMTRWVKWKTIFCSQFFSANIDQAHALTKENRRITINELAESLGISAGSAVKIMNTLGYSKVFARWVAKQLTEAYTQSRLQACFELLEYCHSDKTFLSE